MKRRLKAYKKTVSIVDESTIALYESLGREKKGFLMESNDKENGRYTFMGVEPEALIQSDGESLVITKADGTKEVRRGNPLERLKEYYPGGFVNISQNTKRVFFTGTFTAGGLKEEVRDGRLVILQEGRSKKFRRQVEQITFSGDYAVKSGQDVTFLTERAVLKLTPDGLMLTEIAPGVELEQDILAQMEFRPLISPELREMDHRIFQAGPMGLTL